MFLVLFSNATSLDDVAAALKVTGPVRLTEINTLVVGRESVELEIGLSELKWNDGLLAP